MVLLELIEVYLVLLHDHVIDKRVLFGYRLGLVKLIFELLLGVRCLLQLLFQLISELCGLLQLLLHIDALLFAVMQLVVARLKLFLKLMNLLVKVSHILIKLVLFSHILFNQCLSVEIVSAYCFIFLVLEKFTVSSARQAQLPVDPAPTRKYIL